MIRERVLTISTLTGAHGAIGCRLCRAGKPSNARAARVVLRARNQADRTCLVSRPRHAGRGAARPNRAGGDQPPNGMPLPVFRRTRRTKKRSPDHMLTLTRSGKGLIQMASNDRRKPAPCEQAFD